MTKTFRVITGWDNAGSVADMTVQPNMPVPQPARAQRGGDGLVVEDGGYTTSLQFGIETKAKYTATLAQLGLTSVRSAKVSLQIPTYDRASTEIWNAIVERPADGPEYFSKWVDIVFPVTLIEVITP
jgi:hypothetical protein